VAALVNELEPKRMLDVGCATGHLRILCPAVPLIVGIDGGYVHAKDQRSRRLNGRALLPKVVTGVQFIDGEELQEQAA
jgi:hypothetical protein